MSNCLRTRYTILFGEISLPSLSSCTTPPLGDRPFRPPLGRETGDIKPLILDCCRVHVSCYVSFMLDLHALLALMSLHLYSSRGFIAVVNLVRLPMTHLCGIILGFPRRLDLTAFLGGRWSVAKCRLHNVCFCLYLVGPS